MDLAQCYRFFAIRRKWRLMMENSNAVWNLPGLASAGGTSALLHILPAMQMENPKK